MIENLEGQVRRQTGLADENRKKLLQAEVKLRQLTQATLKDLKAKIKDQKKGAKRIVVGIIRGWQKIYKIL